MQKPKWRLKCSSKINIFIRLLYLCLVISLFHCIEKGPMHAIRVKLLNLSIGA